MQYVWHKGNNIFAGGLFTDVTYVVDTSQLPKLTLKAVNLPHRHPVRLGAGRLLGDQGRRRLRHLHGRARPARSVPATPTAASGSATASAARPASWSASTRTARPSARHRLRSRRRRTSSAATTSRRCPSPTCANPHGVQAREDLDILITSDYNEPRNIILNPVSSPSSYLRRPTVRTWDISDRDNPKLKAVSFLPDGPRVGKVAHQEEPRAAMETTVTNLPGHKGAFAQTMQGGAIYYSPDITVDKPRVA